MIAIQRHGRTFAIEHRPAQSHYLLRRALEQNARVPVMVVIEGSHIAQSSIKGYFILPRPLRQVTTDIQPRLGGQHQQCTLHRITQHLGMLAGMIQPRIVAQQRGLREVLQQRRGRST